MRMKKNQRKIENGKEDDNKEDMESAEFPASKDGDGQDEEEPPLIMVDASIGSLGVQPVGPGEVVFIVMEDDEDSLEEEEEDDDEERRSTGPICRKGIVRVFRDSRQSIGLGRGIGNSYESVSMMSRVVLVNHLRLHCFVS